MRRPAASLLFLVLSLLLTVAGAWAQDGLYAPVRPDETALVRLIHVNPAANAAPVTIDVGTVRWRDVAAQSGTAYRAVRPGVYVIMAYGHRMALTATTGTFYSVVLAPSGITTFSDTYHDDPLRAQVVLYNLTEYPASLDAVIPEGVLLESVDAGGSQHQVINAIPVTLAASLLPGNGEAGPAGAPDHERGAIGRYEVALRLERGASYGIVISRTDAGIKGFVLEASVGPSE